MNTESKREHPATKDVSGGGYLPPTITVAGVTVEHNSQSWRVATNRHRNTDGTNWGWIEGAPGNICWSNNGTFNVAAAAEMVAGHNQWLEDQKPLSIRLIEARQRWSASKAAYDTAKAAFERASAALDKCDEEMLTLTTALSEQQS